MVLQLGPEKITGFRKGLIRAAAATGALGALYLAAGAAFNFYILPRGTAVPLNGAAVVDCSGIFSGDLFHGAGSAAAGTGKTDARLPFSSLLRVEVPSPTPKPYNVQISLPTREPVRAGDILAVRFYVRRPLFSPSYARTDFVFESAGDSYHKSISLPAEAGLRWRRVEAVFPSAAAYPPGKAQANFRLGFGPQVIELAGFELVNLGKKPAGPLPAHPGYEGREPGAPWREAAARRIENLRKGAFTVRVEDPSGRPVPGAEVSIKQVRHSFSFGSSISAKFLYARNREDNKRKYRRLFARLFNSATMENDLKWPYWKGERRGWADLMARWLMARGIRLRGHTLVWPGWSHMPEWTKELSGRPEKLRAGIRDHVAQEAASCAGKVYEWDVLNEPLDNTDVEELLGPEEAAEWFRIARRADPEARLFINEHGILDDMGTNHARHAALENLVLSLRGQGAPLDGIGLQCHFGWDLTPPERLLTVLDRFGKLGLPLHATELDISVPDEKLQADYLRDFMTVMFSHPAVKGVTLWVLWEGLHSEPMPALYRRDWSRKPAAVELERLLLKEWRTDLKGRSGPDGSFSGRAFFGDYEVNVSSGNLQRTVPAEFSADGGGALVVLGRSARR